MEAFTANTESIIANGAQLQIGRLEIVLYVCLRGWKKLGLRLQTE